MLEAYMKIRYAFILLTVAFTLSSCEIFTTSVGKNLARDNSEIYDKQSSSDLIELATTPEAINDPEVSAQILEALGKKNDLTSLSAEEKDVVLNLMIGSTITTDTISETLESIQNLTEDAEVVDLFDTLLDTVDDADINAVVMLLNDPNSLDQMNPFNAMMSAMCIMAQVAKDEEGISTFSNINQAIDELNNGTSVDDILNGTLFASVSEETKDAVEVALNCFSYYQGHPEKVSEAAIGNMTVLDIINAF